MGKSDLVQKVGGTNTLLVPGSQKLGGTGPPVPMVVAPMKRCRRRCNAHHCHLRMLSNAEAAFVRRDDAH
jgi:hypothetical protein